MPSRSETVRESWRRFGEFLPETRRPAIAALVGAGVVVGCAALLTAGAAVADAAAAGPLIVQAAYGAWAAAFMLGGFWRLRPVYRERYAERAYQKLFFRFLLPAVTGGIAALFFPIFVSGERLLPRPLAWGIAAYLLLTAQLLERRGPEIFWSWDIRAFVYSVIPERAQVLTSGVFRFVRHPVYSAMVRWALALGLVRNNPASVACGAMVVAGLWAWSRVEERDLERSSPDYALYRRDVPALFSTRPLAFWRYLGTGRSD